MKRLFRLAWAGGVSGWKVLAVWISVVAVELIIFGALKAGVQIGAIGGYAMGPVVLIAVQGLVLALTHMTFVLLILRSHPGVTRYRPALIILMGTLLLINYGPALSGLG